MPFYLRTGKRLPRRVSEVAVQFKRPPIAIFRDTPVEDLQPNLMILRIQPDEGIALRICRQTCQAPAIKIEYRAAWIFPTRIFLIWRLHTGLRNADLMTA